MRIFKNYGNERSERKENVCRCASPALSFEVLVQTESLFFLHVLCAGKRRLVQEKEVLGIG